MRSYYAHLTTTEPAAPANSIIPRPVMRTSAIFPVIQQAAISSRILFMGYWILKRNIHEITTIVTLRTVQGKIIARTSFSIQEAKTFRIELADQLELAGLNRNSDFLGSLEVEFFSTQNFLFPYPAAVINYYGPQFSTVVHTAQRIYNDFEDMIKNTQTTVPESGFNIYVDSDKEPFISLINGCVKTPKRTMRMFFINHAGQSMEYSHPLGEMNPYETTWIYPARHCNLKKFLNGMPGTAKVSFEVNWIFPRLVVGNIQNKLPALTITHSYYDCSEATADSDYWRAEEVGWHAAALMLPGAVSHHHFTNIYFYPIYSPSKFSVDIEIYSDRGALLGSKKEVALIGKAELKIHCIDLKAICAELGINFTHDCALRLVIKNQKKGKIPARIKIGFDVGAGNINTPCNICTNLQPFNPSLENKPTSFRWSPVLADQPKATLWIMNSSPAINYNRSAKISLTFFRESDTKVLTREIELPPHGFSIIRIPEDKELKSFFQGKIGWMTATTTNPYTTTYYFAENPSGVVGGDHGF